MIFGRARGRESESCGDLGARRRHTSCFEMASNPVEDLLLARRETRDELRRAMTQMRKRSAIGRRSSGHGYRMDIRYRYYRRQWADVKGVGRALTVGVCATYSAQQQQSPSSG